MQLCDVIGCPCPACWHLRSSASSQRAEYLCDLCWNLLQKQSPKDSELYACFRPSAIAKKECPVEKICACTDADRMMCVVIKNVGIQDPSTELEVGPFYLAGECVTAGTYRDLETQRQVILDQAGFLPASGDGRVACYVRIPDPVQSIKSG
jgi:hypothetical protein